MNNMLKQKSEQNCEKPLHQRLKQYTKTLLNSYWQMVTERVKSLITKLNGEKVQEI